MAQPSSSLSGFSLTGNLCLSLKSKGLFKGQQHRNYWFWFDEQSCSLKYYKGKETYITRVNEPLGSIDLRFAKVTPGIASGNSSKQFQISVNQQLYVFSAGNEEEALNWIEKLQEKRSEWIKMSSAMEENAQEKEKERRAFRPLNTQPGSVLASQDVSSSPPSVRKIFSTRLQGNIDRHSVSLDLVHNKVELPSPTTPPDEDTDPIPMDPDQRRRLELETKYLESRGEADKLRKELMKITSQIESKDKVLMELRGEVSQLKEELAKLNKPQSDLQLENESLKDVLEQYRRSLKSLDEEINLHRMNQTEHDKRISMERTKLLDTERELLSAKAKYIRLFSDKFKPSVQGVGDEDDPGEEQSNAELISLLKQESGDNPLFKGYRESFEDQYGDIHDWGSGVTTQLYLCRQLYLHYTIQGSEQLVEEWVGYMSQVKRARGKQHLELPSSGERSKRRELKYLLRKGLPLQFRTQVWSSLIHRVIGKVREVRDGAAGKDTSYYQALLTTKHNSSSIKQIRLDLYRTLPSNIHFKHGGSGAPKLENVLLAYSLHNKNVGYCQGMNMLAAIGLLFLDEELDFWFLVAVIDKLMPPHYFSPGLLAPQADQAVVLELVAQKLPRLHSHFQRYSIDVTLVTFNWFLTLFVDALPTETVLRILDCFLLEGEKVLFRMSLGILKINERKILSLTDPVALFQFLKEVARHTYDIEALFQAAYIELNPFPSRSVLSSRHQHHFAIAREQWNEREKQRTAMEQVRPQNQLRDFTSAVRSLPPTPDKRTLVWETGCMRVGGEVWMACTENQETHLALITGGGSEVTEVPITQIGSRVICMFYVPSCDLMLLGTLDFYLHAVHCPDQQHLWSIKLNDSVLAITGQQAESYTVFAAMADGCVAVIQGMSHSTPNEQPLFLRIGSNSAVQCLVISKSSDLWCGCGKAITVMSTETLEAVQSLVMPDQVGKVYKMERGVHGVWVTFRNSCVVCLYDSDYYIKLLQIDYTSQVPTDNIFSPTENTRAAKGTWEHRVTALMTDKDNVWLGTGSGSIYVFSVVAGVANPSLFTKALAKQTGVEVVKDFRERAGSGGGLLSPLVEDGEEAHLDRRRKTVFGRTFRGGGRRSFGVNSPGVYKLRFEESHHAPLPLTEAVRILLNSCKGHTGCVVSCMNSPDDWQRGLQFWTCGSVGEEWVCKFLSSSQVS